MSLFVMAAVGMPRGAAFKMDMKRLCAYFIRR
jgi:hypothetical protein